MRWNSYVFEPIIDERPKEEHMPLGEQIIRNCPFELACDQSWAQLEATEEPSVRHCLRCRKNVHLCETTEALRVAMEQDLCVAVRRPSPGKMRLGKPAPTGARKAPIVPVPYLSPEED
jgi:hypothetical protein